MSWEPVLHLTQDVAHGIAAVAFDNIHRVDAIAFRLAHPFAFAIQNRGVDKDVSERHIAQVIQAHQDHAGDP